MSTITTKDGTQIYYKDWGSGQPIVFSHGWPLSADDWDAQMIFFASRGFRCIAHDRRGHGRSTQTWDGNEMDTYADDLVGADREARPEERDSRRALDRRRRGRALHRPPRRRPRQGPRRQGGARRRRAAAHAEDGRESRRAADRGLRRLPRRAAGRPGAVLPGRPHGPVLRLQSSRREGVAGHHRQLVAAGDDVRASRPPTTASRPSARPTSPRTSRRSTSRRWSCTATTTRSSPSAPARCSRASWSGTRSSRCTRACRTACARRTTT